MNFKNNENIFDLIESLHDRINLIEKEIDPPFFHFALREDLKDDLRFIPTKGEPLATGYDVRAAQLDRNPIIIKAGQYAKVPLGFRSYCPDGWYYQLHPRSSSFAKKYMHNLIGIIDESWEGITTLVAQYLPDVCSLGKDLVINFGDPIAQIIPVKRLDVTVIPLSNQQYDEKCIRRNAVRKTGGFGSTSEGK